MVMWLFGRMQSSKTLSGLDAACIDQWRLLLSKEVPVLQLPTGSITEDETSVKMAESRPKISAWSSYCENTMVDHHFDAVRKRM